MGWTDNPVYDYDRYCMEQERIVSRLPKCCECENHITDDYAYYINGDWYCKDCLDKLFERPVEEEE